MEPKILLFDIETSPNLAYSFGGKWEVNVVAFKKHFEILSFAYKYLGEKEVTCVSMAGQQNDLHTVRELRKILHEADVVIGHNVDSFDVRKFTARLAFYDLAPTKILSTVDTKKVARRYFGFNSNSLDDLGEYLGLGRKIKHEGIKLWLDVMADEPEAWRKMEEYNIQDVILLEQVYIRLRPWIQNHPNIAKLKERNGCPNCGSDSVIKAGIRANTAGFRQQMQCKSCRGYYLTRYIAPVVI